KRFPPTCSAQQKVPRRSSPISPTSIAAQQKRDPLPRRCTHPLNLWRMKATASSSRSTNSSTQFARRETFRVTRRGHGVEAALFCGRSNLRPFEICKYVGNVAPTHGATADVAVLVSAKKSDLAGTDENGVCALLARERDLRWPTGNTLQVKIAGVPA